MNPQSEKKSGLEDKSLRKKIKPNYMMKPRLALKEAIKDTKAKYKKIF
jgi:hypothetical protein